MEISVSNQEQSIQEPHTWRTFLAALIENAQERQRIAEALGVNPVTLTRWVKGETEPRPSSLVRLLNILPQHRAHLLALLRAESPQLLSDVDAESGQAKEIPSSFYADILGQLTRLTHPGQLWSIRRLLLQHALERLDPEQLYVGLMLATCLPPKAGKKVRSQREVMAIGVAPWGGTLGARNILLGAEFLAGVVLASGRSITNQGGEQGIHRGFQVEVF